MNNILKIEFREGIIPREIHRVFLWYIIKKKRKYILQFWLVDARSHVIIWWRKKNKEWETGNWCVNTHANLTREYRCHSMIDQFIVSCQFKWNIF
jgi:hypothetical protein